MKSFKKLSLILCLVLLIGVFFGCGKKEDANPNDDITQKDEKVLLLPNESPLVLTFSSGAGGWYSYIYLSNDGSFVGSYSDSELGMNTPEYPNGTVYVCDFSGEFEIVEKTDDTSYSLKLVNIETNRKEGEEWIEDNVRYIASVPFGLDRGEDYILYTPEKEIKDLPDEFLTFWPLRYESSDYTTISVYGLHNLTENYGFFETPYR